MNAVRLIPILAGFLFSGCAALHDFPTLFHQRPALTITQNEPVSVPADPPAGTGPRKVSFALEKGEILAPDNKQPETLADFALRLADRGEPGKAAAFFLEAADSENADSKGNEFRIASVAAAASLYLEAGEIQGFHDAVGRLRTEMDRFQLAGADPKIQLLFAISDQLKGKRPTMSPQIPGPVQDLFRNEDRRKR